MRKLYTVETVAANRSFYSFVDKTAAGERLEVFLTAIYNDSKAKNSLPVLWERHGYTPKRLCSYFVVDVYATDEKGNCRGKYNPTIDADGKLNFEWVLEVSEENRIKILNEIYRLATRPSVRKGLERDNG